MRLRFCLGAALVLLVAAPVRADLAPPPPVLPVYGKTPRPHRIVISGLALSAAVASAGLIVGRRGRSSRPFLLLAAVLLAATGTLAAWSWSQWGRHDHDVKNRDRFGRDSLL